VGTELKGGQEASCHRLLKVGGRMDVSLLQHLAPFRLLPQGKDTTSPLQWHPSATQEEDGHLPERTQTVNAKAKGTGCPRSLGEKQMHILGFLWQPELGCVTPNLPGWGTPQGAGGKDLFLLTPTARGKEGRVRWPLEEGSSTGVCQIYFSSTIPSVNSYTFSNLFYLVACPKPYCTQRKATE